MDKMKLAEAEVLLWAKRTVFFAITLRAEDDSQFVDDKKQSGHATRAAQRVVAELWEELAKEARPMHRTKSSCSLARFLVGARSIDGATR